MPSDSRKPKTAAAVLKSRTSVAAVAGLLVTALAIPVFAVTSFASASTIEEFDDLPGYLSIGSQPQQNTIYATHGQKEDGSPKYQSIATVYSQNRQEILWEDVTPVLKNAVLAAEDRRFYEHGGIDVQGIIRAVITDITTGSQQGASTLTQQTVKNVCIAEAFKNYPDADEVENPEEWTKYQTAVVDCNEGTIDRKIREMKYAIGLEKEYSKDEILLAYLNIANYGGTVYGIQSAAQRYYDIDAQDLTLVQAASLIAIVQQPGIRRLDIEDNYENNTVRRDRILKNMASYGYITAAERDEALAVVEGSKNDTLDIQDPQNGCYAANPYAKQFCDYVVKNVVNYEALGETKADRLAAWRIGGYSVYTTLDITLQKVAQNAVKQYAPRDEDLFALGASAVSVEEGTGRILTMAQNKSFDDTGNGNKKVSTALNFNTDGPYGGSNGFQVGSTYKVFTLINWLMSGRGLNERVPAYARTVPQSEFTDSCIDGQHQGVYKFRNDSGTASNITVRQATAASVNGAYVSMALALDLCDTREIARSLGVHRAAPVRDLPGTDADESRDIDDLSTNPSSILGIDNISPLTVAAAYAGIANKGKYCTPVAVDKFVDANGTDIGGQASTCTQAIPEDVAIATESALGTAMGSYRSNPRDGTPLIGKTGTTNASNQTWVTGASTKVATTVWYGNISGDYPIRNYYAPGAAGGDARHMIMNAILREQNILYPGGEFEQPDPRSRLVTGQTQTVGNYTGGSEDSGRSAAERAGFTVREDSPAVASDLPEGQVVKTSPSAGSRVSRGSEITLYLSDGSQSAVPDVTYVDEAAARGALQNEGFTNVSSFCVAEGAPDPLTGLLPDGSAPTPPGTVVEQRPDAGTVKSADGLVRLGLASPGC